MTRTERRLPDPYKSLKAYVEGKSSHTRPGVLLTLHLQDDASPSTPCGFTPVSKPVASEALSTLLFPFGLFLEPGQLLLLLGCQGHNNLRLWRILPSQAAWGRNNAGGRSGTAGGCEGRRKRGLMFCRRLLQRSELPRFRRRPDVGDLLPCLPPPWLCVIYDGSYASCLD